MFRRTVATAVNTNASIELASELLGHTDTKITVQHYIQRSEMVNPATAALLDRAFAKDEERTRCCHGGRTVYPGFCRFAVHQ
jgi:metal-responsive CopG/Arc/MetJ family transcriptional regulator